MKKNRILFVIWLLLWIVIWIAGQNPVAVLIAIASLLCEAAEIPIVRHFCRNISVDIQCSSSLQKNTETEISMMLNNPTKFSGSRGECELLCENLLTGEKTGMRIPFALPAKSADRVQTGVSFSHCGKIAISVRGIYAYDIFGIYRAKATVECNTASLVLPQLYPTNLRVSPGQITDIESDEYSLYKPGFDASETYALRSYKEGDGMKQIHWKLSQKAEEIIVREFSLPIKNSLLILMDNTKQDGSMPIQAEAAEAMGEIAISLSMELCERNYEHHIAWMDHAKGEIKPWEISGEEDLNIAMPEILSAGIREDSVSIFAHMVEANMEYAHVILLTLSGTGEGEMPMLPAETKVSVLPVGEYQKFKENGIYAEV